MSSLPTVECYFGAGPAKLPAEVLEEAKATLLNYPYRGLSILEMSHRDKQFDKILDNSILCLRKLMNIPSHYKIFFMQGGGTAQFAACPLNLLGNISVEEAKKKRPGYIVTGAWSQKAIAEAKKYCNPFVIVDSKQPDGSYSSIHTPEHWEWQTELPPYVYYCENETIHGIEFSQPPVLPATYQGKVPLVGDLSSNFLSRPVDVTKYDVIFAGAQKNSGIAGLTTVIIREDLLNRALSITPTILHYKSISDGNSVLNTPPTFGIHVAGLVFEWLVKQGGLEAIGKKNEEKSKLLYEFIDSSTFFKCKVSKGSRSRMNIVFGVNGEDHEKKETTFDKEATQAGLMGLQGHRSAGGLRASLYNAVDISDVKKLIEFMKSFEQKHSLPLQ